MSKNSKNNIPLIIITSAIVIVFGIVFVGAKFSTNNNISNTEIKDGVQYITINARGGYSPQLTNAQAGIPTKLIVKTSGTFDCSASLIIRSLGFQKILPNSGQEIIDAGTPVSGVPLTGICGMGMYNFKINFN